MTLRKVHSPHSIGRTRALTVLPQDTTSIGVIIVHIHRGIGLEKMDSRESSGKFGCIILIHQHGLAFFTHAHLVDTDSADPYVTVAYTKQGKPLFSTRIIFADLNPIFEEMAAVTVDILTTHLLEAILILRYDLWFKMLQRNVCTQVFDCWNNLMVINKMRERERERERERDLKTKSYGR